MATTTVPFYVPKENPGVGFLLYKPHSQQWVKSIQHIPEGRNPGHWPARRSGEWGTGGGGLSPLTFAGEPVHVAELVASPAVTLVGAVDVGALLAAGAAATLIHV